MLVCVRLELEGRGGLGLNRDPRPWEARHRVALDRQTHMRQWRDASVTSTCREAAAAGSGSRPFLDADVSSCCARCVQDSGVLWRVMAGVASRPRSSSARASPPAASVRVGGVVAVGKGLSARTPSPLASAARAGVWPVRVVGVAVGDATAACRCENRVAAPRGPVPFLAPTAPRMAKQPAHPSTAPPSSSPPPAPRKSAAPCRWAPADPPSSLPDPSPHTCRSSAHPGPASCERGTT